ncbi:MAG TPA: phosphotransferase [Aliidongia sp.]|uniref:phosphotransferase n=1 Tax=Aliidongia sp. TaxID=1914230 RepID=UPI002DDD9D9B|nr:phosphotransferase [Aliidongia sp.]HEV2673859.1 phosphotransferase [Aliidongia sp.]
MADARPLLPPTGVGPDEFLAAAIVEAALNGAAAGVRRFEGSARHFVFDVQLTDGRRAVVRLGNPEHRTTIRDAALWSDRLRHLGVKLPKILARDLTSEFPSLILERLDGGPLLQTVDRLKAPHLGLIAGTLADMQHKVAGLKSAERYGWASTPESAPHTRWSDALAQDLSEARGAIQAAGLVDATIADMVERRLARQTAALDRIPALAFMAEPATRDAIVTEAGRFSGLVDVDQLGWGDPRIAIARTLFDLLEADKPPGFAEAWLALAGATADRTFWLYVALAGLRTMADYGTAGRHFRIADRDRIDRVMTRILARCDRPDGA